jgi:3-oxoacyl-[acyl-carrier protein] reductase
VVITGGEGDLARALAEVFEAHNYVVFRPGRHELDVRSSDSVSAFFSSLEKISVLINNAGITGDTLVGRATPERWGNVIDTNLKGAHLCSRAVATKMAKAREGHIVNIGSYSALHPATGQSAYAAAKAGLIGLTKSYAKEFGSRNIRVNCVLPGFLDNRMTRDLPDEIRNAARERHALKRFNDGNEAARFIHFLSTTANISGQSFQLDSRT